MPGARFAVSLGHTRRDAAASEASDVRMGRRFTARHRRSAPVQVLTDGKDRRSLKEGRRRDNE